MLSTLVTQDREIEDQMLQYYPGKIFEQNYEKNILFPDCKVFMFKDLDNEELESFLKQFKDKEYALYSEGRPVHFNRPDKFKIDWKIYLNQFFSRN